MCDLTDMSYTQYFRLLNKITSEYVQLRYSNENLSMMHRTGLIVHI